MDPQIYTLDAAQIMLEALEWIASRGDAQSQLVAYQALKKAAEKIQQATDAN
jgi:hypothetical protein